MCSLRKLQIISCVGTTNLEMRLSKTRLGTTSTDVELSVPSLRISLCQNSISALVLVHGAYFSALKKMDFPSTLDRMINTDSVMQLMRHLDRLDGRDEDSELDFERLEVLMNQYREVCILESIIIRQIYLSRHFVNCHVIYLC